MSGEAKHVTIGGRPYTVARFKTYKAVLVGEVMSKVTKEVRGLFKEAAEFRREYRAENPMQITRQMCLERVSELESAAKQSRAQVDGAPTEAREGGGEEDQATKADYQAQASLFDARAQSWQRQLEDMGERSFIEIPRDPDDMETAMAVFPRAFGMRRELAELLALIVTPDADLQSEWRKDSVHDLLRRTGEEMLEESEPAEIIELALVAKQVMGDQFRPLAPALRSIWESWTDETPEAKDEKKETVSTPMSGSPTSSTESPEPTDGDSKPSSSTSPGELLSPSSSA